MSEEARVGQRTTLDVLNAQQDLVNARVSLVTAQRDRVVASYNVLAAVGSLSPQVLALGVPNYDPMTHYQQVRDSGSAFARRTDAKSFVAQRDRTCVRPSTCLKASSSTLSARSVGGTGVCVRSRSHHWMSALSGPIWPKTALRFDADSRRIVKVRLRAGDLSGEAAR